MGLTLPDRQPFIYPDPSVAAAIQDAIDSEVAVAIQAAIDAAVAAIWDTVYPVGSLLFSVNSANPGTYFGGTWVAFGTGRAVVGVDTGDTDFDAVEETGGSKTSTAPHTHAVDPPNTRSTTNLQNHAGHSGKVATTSLDHQHDSTVAQYAGRPTGAISFTGGTQQGAEVSGHEHDVNIGSFTSGGSSAGATSGNLQPYITCYIWKRTA